MEIVENNEQGALHKVGESVQETYREALELAREGREQLRSAVLRLADCGELLISARPMLKGQDWNAWVQTLGIDPTHAQKSVHLARNRDQLELDLWPQDVAKIGAQFVGVLPPSGSSNREENDPERRVICHWFQHAGKLTKSLQGLLANREIDDLRADERENLASALKPIADLYAELRKS
jgi:hypothetical protein